MKRYLYFIGLCMWLSNCAKAQFVNDGVKLFIGNDAVLYVDGNVGHKGGEVLNQGRMVVKGNWENNSNSKVFDNRSKGNVVIEAKTMVFQGTGKTVFPNLIFNSDGAHVVKSQIEARLSLDLGNSELQVGSAEGLVLSNSDPGSLYRKKGFINTSLVNGASFVRYTKQNQDYLYPLGTSKSGMMRFVVIRPREASDNAYAVSFLDRDAGGDGYSRWNKAEAIGDINDRYYHTVKHINGMSAADISFYVSPTENYNSLVGWAKNNSWSKLQPVNAGDNVSITPGLSKSFTYQSASLPLGSSVPFALAQVSTVGALEFYNAFSPDGDGKNDTWEVKNIDAYPDNDLKIYDRSGNLVYRTTGYNSTKYWDGQNVTAGTYIYIMRVKIDGVDKYYKGSITMVKN